MLTTGLKERITGGYQAYNRCRSTCCCERSRSSQMTGISIRLGPGECSDIETGARYFAAYAFPGKDEQGTRNDAASAWVGTYLHEQNRIDGCEGSFAESGLNEFAAMTPVWCKAQIRTARRRLRDRSRAAQAVRPWIGDIMNHPHPPMPEIRKFTQRQISLFLNGDRVEKAAIFQKRVWRPCRPVMHLASACDIMLPRDHEDQTEFTADLAAVGLFGQLVEKANVLQPLISADYRFGIGHHEQLTLLWVA
jgi:hypothetical protein